MSAKRLGVVEGWGFGLCWSDELSVTWFHKFGRKGKRKFVRQEVCMVNKVSEVGKKEKKVLLGKVA